MAVKIGDKIKFLNEEGGGEITQLIDKDTVMVLSNIDDFEIPVLIREIVVVGGDEKSENQLIEVFESELRINKSKRFFSVFAEERKEYNYYLVNGKNQAVFFGIFEERKSEILGIYSGILQPGGVQKINTYSLKDFDAIVQWRVQGFFFEKRLEKITAPINCVVKIHPKKFFNPRNKKFVEEIGKEGVVVELEQKESVGLQADELFANSPKEKQFKKEKSKNSARKNTREILEVDLHIHELLETTSGMSNSEILEYQLDKFRKVLEENKKFKGKRIVFIHGVGNGVLKQRIRHELQKCPHYTVQDASFQEYGWGATMIIVK